MYEQLEQCPLCESGHFRNYMICQDHAISGDSFAIVECVHCGFKFTNPRPGINEIQEYYDSDEYISHSNKSSSSLISFVYKIVRERAIKNKYDIIRSLETEKRILDVGCGTGNFLSYFKERGWDITGVEPNKLALEKSKELLKTPQLYSSLDEVPTKPKYDIITLWHVLEHIHDLNDTIRKIKKMVRKKGYIVIALPNIESADAKHYREFWAGYDVPRHLYHFSSKTFSKLLQKHKMRISKTLPMYYDSYYVSLLSEKYKTGKNGYVSAFFNGLKSNRQANNTQEYSSLIYIVKK